MPALPTISIIDDDASFRRAAARLMRSLGHNVASFCSAEEFLQSGLVDNTKCVISDVQMPGMSGIELQNHLLDRGYTLPIIFVTAYPESSARAQALASGALGFFNKTFNEQDLISCVARALSQLGT